MISKLTHFPLLFSFLPCRATILHAALFTWHCNVSPTHVIKILYRLWFNTVIIRHVRQQQSVSKHRKNKPPRKKKTGKERRVGKGSTQFRSWKADSGRWQRFPREGGGNGSCLSGAVETEARTLAVAGSALEAGAAHKARESKSARRDNQTPPCSRPQPPPWARLNQRGSELRVTRHSGRMAGLQRRAQVKVYVLNGGASSYRPHSDSSKHHQTHCIRQSLTL